MDRGAALGYAGSGLDATDDGLRRLQHMERLFDAHTFASLESLDIPEDWRCLEIGAGAGSVARWLASKVPAGEVVATDLDISRLPRDIANLRPLEHDVRTDDFPAGAFDLVHARSVLQHLADAPAVLLRAVEWVRPGGWIVIEEIDIATGSTSPLPQLRAVTMLALDLISHVIGGDTQFCRRVPSLLKDAGLASVGATFRGQPVGDGGPMADILSQSLSQLRNLAVSGGFAAEEELEGHLSWLATNETIDVAALTISAWGRRPLETTTDPER